MRKAGENRAGLEGWPLTELMISTGRSGPLQIQKGTFKKVNYNVMVNLIGCIYDIINISGKVKIFIALFFCFLIKRGFNSLVW